MTLKEKLHRLVDELPEEECHAAERYLEYLRDQGDLLLHRLASAPYDDEPETQGRATSRVRRHTRTCKPVVHTPWKM